MNTTPRVFLDTADINCIAPLNACDITTNPSLLYVATCDPSYQHIVKTARNYVKEQSLPHNEQHALFFDVLSTSFGIAIAKNISGIIATHVDPRTSFDTTMTITRALRMVRLYEKNAIGRDRLYITIAATWEGLEAARYLEKQGVHCMMTLTFSMLQAFKAADVGATAISPSVGRISDWHKHMYNRPTLSSDENPGVAIALHMKKAYNVLGSHTKVIATSVRSPSSAYALDSIDGITVSPKLFPYVNTIPFQNDHPQSEKNKETSHSLNEAEFKHLFTGNRMASELLLSGNKRFCLDAERLERHL